MKKYQILHKVLSLRRIGSLSVTIVLFTLLGTFPSKVFATNGGAVTTADKIYVFDYTTHMSWVGASNSLFKASFNIPSPGTSTIDGDLYQGTLAFTKLPNSDYRLLNVIPYMDSPTFTITDSGGVTAASGAYKWDETLQAWALPNPLIDNTSTSIDTSQALNGTAGIKIYMTGTSTSFMPLSALRNDPTLLKTRPVFLLGDVAGLTPNLVQNIPFNLYQERAYNGDPNKWHAFNFNVPALVEYEYDGQVRGSNPEDQLGLVPGGAAHFESEVNLSSPQKITVDMVWQRSKDKGLSFNDIPESLTNSGGDNTLRKTLDFISDIPDEGSLYRLKVTPIGSKNNEPIYTEPAVLTFKPESLSFNIHYVLNGGINHPANPLTYTYGRGISNFEGPQREGYIFTGWTDKEGNSIANISTDAQGDKTLYANWQASTYKINYILNGGENSDQNPNTYVYGQGIPRIEKAMRQGYTFIGWTDQNGEKIEALSVEEQGDKTLYASWKKVAVVSNENEDTKDSKASEKDKASDNIKKIQYTATSVSFESRKERDSLPQTGEKGKTSLYILGALILVALSVLGVKKYLVRL
ncbi:InlB B-repeat-containing protein [Lactococcus ileimucosae]|uniref:InlB B-repeat-containing protein n=1 Tax=Lactococcus ileimucosae TaxID=2941329 RepID=UPI0020432C6D|nr:InlB B-repeat-containing protein [Lactococcus ileimucosae]